MSLILTDNRPRGAAQYKIESVRDLLAVPDDRLDDCLAGLRDWVIAARAFNALGQGTPPFIWLDDGRRFLLVRWPTHSSEWIKAAVQSHIKAGDRKTEVRTDG